MHFDGGCSPGGKTGSDCSSQDSRDNGAPCDSMVLGVEQHGSSSSGKEIQKINALRNALIHSHDCRHPNHENTAAANAETGENSTDQAGGACD